MTTKQQKTVQRISYALGLIALAMVAVTIAWPTIFGVAGFALSIANITGTMIGEGQEKDGPTDHRVPSVTEMLTRIEPSRFPFTTFMDRLRSAGTTKQIKHIWPEASRYPRSAVVDGLTTAGSADSAKVITVLDASGLRVNDLVMSPTNATDASFIYIVTVIDGAGNNDVTLWALPVSTGAAPYTMDSYGTVPVFGDTEVLYWVGVAKTESDKASTPRAIQPVYEFNYIHTHDAVVRWSDHKQRSVNWGPQDVARYRTDNLYEFRKSREALNCFASAPSKTLGANGEDRWTQAGIKYYLTRSVALRAPSGVPTTNNVVDFVYNAFDDNGADSKILMGGTDLLQAIDKAHTADLFIQRTEVVAGVTINWLEGRKGRLGTVFSPTFDEQGYRANGMVLDMNHITKRNYQPMELRVGNLKNTGDMVDAEQEQYIEKSTLEVRNKEAHRWVTLDDGA